MTAGALAGLRVVDFGQFIAGPLAAMLLADQGADVVRVDPPGGPRWQVDGNATWNRGKRSIVLDLATGADRAVARDLVTTADVVIENFRPGVMDRLGLGPGPMLERNPALVYCSLPGFAADDPRAQVPGWEGIIGAATGLYTTKRQTGPTDCHADAHRAWAPPSYGALPVASTFAAFVGAASVAVALVARERDGRGQHVEAPLFDATFFAATEPGFQTVLTPWGRQYECADGRWIYLHSTNLRFVTELLTNAGVPEWLDGSLQDPAKVTDPDHAADLVEQLTRLFRTRSSEEWEAVIADGTPAATCRTSLEWLRHPQARASAATIEVDDPVYGPMLQPGLAVRLSETPGGVRAPAPRPDEHRDEILAELRGGSRSPTGPPVAPPDARPPLAGINMVDLSVIRAGPLCGRTLMEFGAEVVKIDDPHGHPPVLSTGRGKLSVYMDLRHDAGRDILGRLVDRADVLAENFRKDKIAGIGFDEASVRTRRPDVVYVSMNAYGYDGPWAHRPGYEYQAQAATGMQERFGGGPPVREPFLVNDHATGLLAAFGTALALYHRMRTGVGQRVETALTYTAMLLQSEFMNDYRGKVWHQPRGQHVLGSGHLHRMYRAADGWLFLGAPDAEQAQLARIEGLEGIDAVPPHQVGMFLQLHLATEPVAAWVDRLTTAGVAAHPVRTLAEARSDPWVIDHQLRVVRDHPDGGTDDTVGPVMRLSRTPVQVGRSFRPSMDAAEVLDRVGEGARLEDLVAAGTIAIRKPG